MKKASFKVVENVLVEGRLRYRIIQSGGGTFPSWKSLTGIISQLEYTVS